VGSLKCGVCENCFASEVTPAAATIALASSLAGSSASVTAHTASCAPDGTDPGDAVWRRPISSSTF
jgi:hypothetical protein